VLREEFHNEWLHDLNVYVILLLHKAEWLWLSDWLSCIVDAVCAIFCTSSYLRRLLSVYPLLTTSLLGRCRTPLVILVPCWRLWSQDRRWKLIMTCIALNMTITRTIILSSRSCAPPIRNSAPSMENTVRNTWSYTSS